MLAHSIGMSLAQLFWKNLKLTPSRCGFDAPRLLRINVNELPTIIALAPLENNAGDDARLGVADARIQVDLCHHGHFLYEHMLDSKRID